MPPINDETPEVLRPFIFHGVDLQWKHGSREATADCPWCGGSSKFSVTIGDGLWRCLVCNEGAENGKAVKGGNNYTFIRQLHERSLQHTTTYGNLTSEWGLLDDATLRAWGVARSIIRDEWIVPGYSINSKGELKLNQLYRYVKVGERFKFLATPGMGVQLFGLQNYDPSKKIIYLCEGVKDGAAWWETTRKGKLNEAGDKFVPTMNPDVSFLKSGNVLGVPGCEQFNESWLPMFAGKKVVLLYDSDHPRKHPKTGARITPPGYAGTTRVAGILLGAEEPPEKVNYLKWGEEGYDPQLPDGHDIRDELKLAGTALPARLRAMKRILDRLEDAPEAWRVGGQKGVNGSGSKKGKGNNAAKDRNNGVDDLELEECESWKTLVTAWRRAMKWTDGLDHALAVMLSSVTSTMSVGDQLWVKVIGPPSCGKSTLCEAISTCKEFVLAKSTMRGFHSGFSDGEDGEDHSLLAKVSGKTLVTKDGDALLQAPNLGQILSEARDVYDTVSRTSYRNKSSKDYQGVRMTWLLCGTSSLRSIDSSELGERFLDCVIMNGIDDDMEDEILMRVAYRAERSLSIEANGEADSHQEPDMTKAMQLTGGYVEYLRKNAQRLLSEITMDERALRLCTRFGKFVAFMRARPSRISNENAEREFAARLVSQHIRLAKCLAAVLNKSTVDEEVIDRTRRIAFDTARGTSFQIVEEMNKLPDGCFVQTVALSSGVGDARAREMLPFLKKIKVVETFTPETVPGGPVPKTRWRLTPYFAKLLAEVNKASHQ